MSNTDSVIDDKTTNHVPFISQDDSIEYKFEEGFNFIENKVINSDGLTLAEVFQVLVKILDDDLELVKKVLEYANIMTKHGMKIAKESQLSRDDILLALEGKKSVINRQDFIKKSSLLPFIKSVKKKGKGL